MSTDNAWECGGCFIGFLITEEQPYGFDVDNYCLNCVIGNIRIALDNEIEAWPPRIGAGHIMMTDRLRDELPAEMVVEYDNAAAWRSIPLPARIWCKHNSIDEENQFCNGFVGQRNEFQEGQPHGPYMIATLPADI